MPKRPAECVVGVAVLDPGHLVFGDEVLPLGLVGVPADADDDEGLAGELFGDLLHVGSSSLQGPHHVAQKSMRTTRPPIASRLNCVPSSAVTVKGGAILRRESDGIFGEVLGAEVAGIFGGDAGEAGFELLAGGFDLAETGEGVAIEIMGVAVFGIVDDGGFERSIGAWRRSGFFLSPA